MPFGQANVQNIPTDVQQWIVQNPQLAEQLGKALGGNRPFGAPNNQMSMGYQQPYQQNDFMGRNSVIGQQPMQTPQNLPGRTINGPQEINLSEIPMDGRVAFFPVNDGSAIYAKCWNSNGGIDTLKFSPEKSPEENSEKVSELDEVINRLGKIENLLARLPEFNRPVSAETAGTIDFETTVSSTGKKPNKKVVSVDA